MTTDRDLARWRLRSQLLAAPVADAETVVRTLLGVQAENPSQSAWAVATRTASPSREDLDAALAEGRVIRTHVLRPTWHYVHADDLRWLLQVTAPRVIPVAVQQLRPLVERMTRLTDVVTSMLATTPDRTRSEVASGLAERDESLSSFELMLFLAHLELHGIVCGGVPRDGEHTYALLDDRVPAAAPRDRDEALAELAARYLSSHGPATERDLSYWATLTLTDARRGIAGAAGRLDSFEHDGRTFWHAPGESPASVAPSGGAPDAHLLQVLDEMYRGYQDSRWVIDADGLVGRGRETAIGMALVDAQFVAAMRRRIGTREVAFELRPYRALRADEVAALEAEATAYGRYLDLDARVELRAG
ncbi:winged helix DNA-binding domain-containing protein [Agromyces luteolus]|uniref:winged helix DNA-binding domain-containing protein n=1 Tax=Agromyces luteolus TaxID=88373 RepID=UPI0012DD05F9|nr:winged helix DNA-binding domain-containing protein [Agromyces luteolus]